MAAQSGLSHTWSQTLKTGFLVTRLILKCADYFQRTLGLRFLFPVYTIPEVEITPNKYTSGQTIEKGKEN